MIGVHKDHKASEDFKDNMVSPVSKDRWDQPDHLENQDVSDYKGTKETGEKLEPQVFQERPVNMVNQEMKADVETQVSQDATEPREIPVQSVREVGTDLRDLKDFVDHVDLEESPVTQLLHV